MAHMIDKMAYVGQTPWHGLGAVLQGDESIDQWRVAAGLDWSVQESPVQYNDGETVHTSADHKVLFRSDRKSVLGVVSDQYRTVQPETILNFYDNVAKSNGFKMDTMGSLSGGKRIWALAQVGEWFSIKGNDTVLPYLMLATSYDKTMATRAMFTTVRVVCNNTLQLAVNADRGGMSISHSAMFDTNKVALDLGLVYEDISDMQDKIQLLSDIIVTPKQATEILSLSLFGVSGDAKEYLSTRSKNLLNNVVSLFNGNGIGSNLRAAENTAWGVVNAATQYIDHSQGNSASSRLNSSWFGTGATVKQKVWTEALRLAA